MSGDIYTRRLRTRKCSMKIEYLKEFVDLAETLNFTKTANKRYLTQPALSNHISTVEDTLGLKLFIRTTHQVKLTKEGKLFYEKIKELVDSYDCILKDANQISKNLKGELTFGILYYAIPEYVTPIIEKFESYYPNIVLKTVSCQPHQIFQFLKDDIIDVGMVLYFGDSEPDYLEYYTFNTEKLCFMMPYSHPLAAKEEITLEEILDETIVDEIMDKEWSQSITNLIHNKKFYPRNTIHAPQVDLLPLVLEKTNGISIVPELLANNLSNSKMVFSKIKDEGFQYEMGICYKPENNNPSIHLLRKICDELGTL